MLDRDGHQRTKHQDIATQEEKTTHRAGTDPGGINTAVGAADSEHVTAVMVKRKMVTFCFVDETPVDTVCAIKEVAVVVGPITVDTDGAGAGSFGARNVEIGAAECVVNSGPTNSFTWEKSGVSSGMEANTENDVNVVVHGESPVGVVKGRKDRARTMPGIGAGGGATTDGKTTVGYNPVGIESGYIATAADGEERIRGCKGRREIHVLVIGSTC